MIHELIDKDVPCCLYCNAEFDTNAMSIRSSSGYVAYKLGQANIARSDAETLYCVDCKETFEIHSTQSDDGVTTYDGFTFTCKGFEVFVNYTQCVIDIRGLKGTPKSTIPSFDPDFSDRDKLYEKLKTYLIFS